MCLELHGGQQLSSTITTVVVNRSSHLYPVEAAWPQAMLLSIVDAVLLEGVVGVNASYSNAWVLSIESHVLAASNACAIDKLCHPSVHDLSLAAERRSSSLG